MTEEAPPESGSESGVSNEATAVQNTGGEAGSMSSRGDEGKLVTDCRMMLRFALDESMILTEELREKIARVDWMLVHKKMESLSGLPSEVVTKPLTDSAKASLPTKESPETSLSLSATLLDVHAGLAALIAPATVQSLRATPPITGLKDIFKLPGIVQLAIIATIICLAGFILTTPGARPKPPVTAEQKAAVAEDKKDSGQPLQVTPSPPAGSPAPSGSVPPVSPNP